MPVEDRVGSMVSGCRSRYQSDASRMPVGMTLHGAIPFEFPLRRATAQARTFSTVASVGWWFHWPTTLRRRPQQDSQTKGFADKDSQQKDAHNKTTSAWALVVGSWPAAASYATAEPSADENGG